MHHEPLVLPQLVPSHHPDVNPAWDANRPDRARSRRTRQRHRPRPNQEASQHNAHLTHRQPARATPLAPTTVTGRERILLTQLETGRDVTHPDENDGLQVAAMPRQEPKHAIEQALGRDGARRGPPVSELRTC